MVSTIVAFAILFVFVFGLTFLAGYEHSMIPKRDTTQRRIDEQLRKRKEGITMDPIVQPGQIWSHLEWWDDRVEIDDVVDGMVEFRSCYDDSVSYEMDIVEFVQIYQKQ